MAGMSEEFYTKSAKAWIDLMKTKLDEYEVERNEYTADYRLPAKNVMFYRDVILPFVENALLMDSIARSESICYSKDSHGQENKLKIRCFHRTVECNQSGNNQIEKEGGPWVELKAEYQSKPQKDNNRGLIGLPPKNLATTEDVNLVVYPDYFPLVLMPQDKNEGDDLGKIYQKLEDGFNEKEISPNLDFEICLPSEHALYSILENFIRNGAKHNKSNLATHGFEVCFHIEDCSDNDYYDVWLFDNVSKVSIAKLSSIVAGKLQNLLDNSGDTRRENLGVADLKINAHLLISRDEVEDNELRDALELVVKNTEPEETDPTQWIFPKDRLDDLSPSLSVDEIRMALRNKILALKIKGLVQKKEPVSGGDSKSDSEEYLYHFGYKFRLAKSKKVCWIGKPNDNTELNKRGIYCFANWETFEKSSTSTLAAYQFAIIELDELKRWGCVKTKEKEPVQDSSEKELDRRLQLLPGRVLINCEKSACKIIPILKQFEEQGRVQPVLTKIEVPSGEDLDFELLKLCWENWLIRFVPQSQVSVDDCQAGEKQKVSQGQLVLYSEVNLKRAIWNRYDFTSDRFKLKVEADDVMCEPAVFWDHHGQCGVKKKDWNFHGQNAYISYGKSNPDYSYIYYNEGVTNKWLLPYEVFESGLTRLMIVDERFTEFSQQKLEEGEFSFLKESDDSGKDKQLSYFDACWAANLYVTTHIDKKPLASGSVGNSLNVNFELDTNGSLKLKTTRNFNENSEASSETSLPAGIDAIVIHRTYLNEEYKQSFRAGLEVEDFLFRLKRIIPHVYLTSGGSFPHGIKGNYKFVSFNELKRSVVNAHGIGKNRLVSLLHNTTRNGNV